MDEVKREHKIKVTTCNVLRPITTYDLIKSYFEGRNRQTLLAYRRDLEDFREFLSVDTLEDSAQVLLGNGHGHGNQIALAYRAYLRDSGLQPTTINRRLSSLRSLVRLARTLGLVPWELEVSNLKAEVYRDTRGPGKSNFEKILFEVTKRKSPKALRDRAILRLLYDLALRASELVGLNIDDVNVDAATISVLRKGKTQKMILTLPKPTLNAISEWIEVRGESNSSSSALFISMDRSAKGQSNRLTRGGLYDMVRNLGKKLNIKIRPHGVRHTSITEAIKLAKNQGLGLDDVLDHSGHSNISTLMVYNDRVQDRQGQIASMVADLLKTK